MPEGIHLYRHRGTRAIQRMVEFAPSTGGLALWVKHQDLPPEINPGPIATDGTTIYYSAAFERLPVAAQAGLVAHEVLHIALRHPQRYLDLRQLLGDVDLELFNICADAIVNSSLSHLSWLELPATSVFLDQLILGALGYQEGVDKALLEWDVERLYRAIDDRQPPGQGRKRQSRSRRRGGIGDSQPGAEGRRSRDQVDDSSQAEVREDGPISARVRALGAETDADLFPQPDAEKQPELEAEQAREWSERILRAHAGDGAHSMLRALIADLPKIRTPWEQILRTQLARGLSMQPNLSWSRPSRSYIANQGRIGPGRRLPWEPGISSAKSVPRLVVIVDVSGSIEDSLMERFAGEIEAITRRLEASLVLVIGDRQVQRVARFEPGRSDLREIEFNGGGGTDFTPLLEEADKHGPDIGVVLTDLDGPANFRPLWPVIWAVPESYTTPEQPFGRKLTLS
jgi:predicted metal-dependent peptidase